MGIIFQPASYGTCSRPQGHGFDLVDDRAPMPLDCSVRNPSPPPSLIPDSGSWVQSVAAPGLDTRRDYEYTHGQEISFMTDSVTTNGIYHRVLAIAPASVSETNKPRSSLHHTYSY